MQTLAQYLESLGSPTSLFRLVETFRANGKLFTDGGVHRMVRDAALELGFWLSVKRARVVPIKKSNPGPRYSFAPGSDPRPFPARTRYVDKGKKNKEAAELRRIAESYELWRGNFSDDGLQRVGAADITFDDHGRHLEQHRVLLMGTPHRRLELGEWYGQRFIQWPWKSDAIFAEILEEVADDLRDAWSLREAINAPSQLRGVSARMVMVDEMAEMGFIGPDEAVRMLSGHMDEHRALMEQATVFGSGFANVSWDSGENSGVARIGRVDPAKRTIEIVAHPAVREGEAFIMTEAGRTALYTGRTQGKSELMRQCAHLLNVGTGVPPPKPKSESRVPPFLQKKRLDGRRR